MLRTVAGLGHGQGSFGQRPSLGLLAKSSQDRGEVVQPGRDGGVVGAVGGLGDGQGPSIDPLTCEMLRDHIQRRRASTSVLLQLTG